MAAAEHHIAELLPCTSELRHRFVRSVHERFDSTLRGFLMKSLRNKAEVEDFAQEVYLRFSCLKNHHDIRSERAFLFTTATNLLRDRSRRLATKLEKASVSIDDVTLECSSGDPFQRAVYAEQQRLLKEAMEDLSENCRRAFRMSRIDGRSYADIADVMGVSVSMVEKHISAALKRLRQGLDCH